MHQIKVIFRRRRKTTILGPEVCPDERGDRKVIAPQPGSRINGPHRASMKHGWSQILNNGGEVWFRARRKRSPASGVGEWFLWCLRKAVCVRGCIRVYVCVCIYIYVYIYIYMYPTIIIISCYIIILWHIMISLIVVAMSIFNIRVVPEFPISHGQPASNKTSRFSEA